MWSKLEAGRKGADATNLILAQGSKALLLRLTLRKGLAEYFRKTRFEHRLNQSA